MDIIMIMTEQEVYRLAGNYPDAQRPSELRALHVRNYPMSKFITNYRVTFKEAEKSYQSDRLSLEKFFPHFFVYLRRF